MRITYLKVGLSRHCHVFARPCQRRRVYHITLQIFWYAKRVPLALSLFVQSEKTSCCISQVSWGLVTCEFGNRRNHCSLSSLTIFGGSNRQACYHDQCCLLEPSQTSSRSSQMTSWPTAGIGKPADSISYFASGSLALAPTAPAPRSTSHAAMATPVANTPLPS